MMGPWSLCDAQEMLADVRARNASLLFCCGPGDETEGLRGGNRERRRCVRVHLVLAGVAVD